MCPADKVHSRRAEWLKRSRKIPSDVFQRSADPVELIGPDGSFRHDNSLIYVRIYIKEAGICSNTIHG